MGKVDLILTSMEHGGSYLRQEPQETSALLSSTLDLTQVKIQREKKPNPQKIQIAPIKKPILTVEASVLIFQNCRN